MNWIDLVIILIVLFFATEGVKRGFYVQLFDILGFLVSLMSALAFYPIVSSTLVRIFNLPQIAANPVGFLVVWIITETLFFAVFASFFKKLIMRFGSTHINRFFGFIPSVLNSLLFLAFALLFIVSLPINPNTKQEIYNSKIGSQLVEKATILEKPFNNIFGPITRQSLTFLTVKPEDKGTVDLGYTQREFTVDTQAEQQMLNLVNEERVKRGFAPLSWNESLAEVGRTHSKDMFERGYFSHYSPEGEDIGDRLEKASVQYTIAGENLALAPNTQRAHSGLMDSPGHRRNILDPAFTKIGIGAINGGVYGLMFTQVFTN